MVPVIFNFHAFPAGCPASRLRPWRVGLCIALAIFTPCSSATWLTESGKPGVGTCSCRPWIHRSRMLAVVSHRAAQGAAKACAICAHDNFLDLFEYRARDFMGPPNPALTPRVASRQHSRAAPDASFSKRNKHDHHPHRLLPQHNISPPAPRRPDPFSTTGPLRAKSDNRAHSTEMYVVSDEGYCIFTVASRATQRPAGTLSAVSLVKARNGS